MLGKRENAKEGGGGGEGGETSKRPEKLVSMCQYISSGYKDFA